MKGGGRADFAGGMRQVLCDRWSAGYEHAPKSVKPTFKSAWRLGTAGFESTSSDAATEFVAGSRYLEPGTQIRVEEIEGRLQIFYLGVILRDYPDWLDYSDEFYGQGRLDGSDNRSAICRYRTQDSRSQDEAG